LGIDHKKGAVMKCLSRSCVGLALASGLLGQAVLADENPPAATAQAASLMTKDLPEFPGKEAVMLTVEYPPGAASKPHRHRSHVFVYVLEGSYATQVAGGERVVLKAGETFYELPTDEHVVSANASDTEPARILVFMLKDKDASK
jgi:quercetin dioxygenase-like cupin family protein